MKIKRKTFWGGIVAALCACTALTFGAVYSPTGTAANAMTNNAIDFIRINELTLNGYDSSNGKVFNGNRLTELFSALTGGTGSTLEDVAATVNGMHSTPYGSSAVQNYLPEYKNAADLYAMNGNKNIVVNFGGQEWAVTFLTTDMNGDVIATLWMTQPLKDETGAFVKNKFGWATSEYSINYNSTDLSTPISAAYSTSALRALSLNGGSATEASSYNTSVTETAEVSLETRNAHPLAVFTLDNSVLSGDKANKSLIDYITQPFDVDYTYCISNPASFGNGTTGSYYLNEALTRDAEGTVVTGKLSSAVGKTNTTFYGSSTNGAQVGVWWNQGVYNYAYSENNHYNDWGSDYVWAPACSEHGSTTQANWSGIWGTGTVTGQLQFTDDSSKVGCWVRSGDANAPSSARAFAAAGTQSYYYTGTARAVRPALHLNLTKAAASKVIEAPQNISGLTYDGTSKWIDNLGNGAPAWLNTAVYDNSQYMTSAITYTDTSGVNKGTVTKEQVKNAGTYTVTMTLASGLLWADGDGTGTRQFTITIGKATPNVDPTFPGGRPFVTSGFPQPTSYTATCNGTDVAGTFDWINQNELIEVGKSKEYEWTFKPEDGNNYNNVTGNATFNFQERTIVSRTYAWKPEYTTIYTATTDGELMDMIKLEVVYNDSPTPVIETNFEILGSTLVAGYGNSEVTVKFGSAIETMTIPATVEVVEAAIENLTVIFVQSGKVITVETPLDELKNCLTVYVKWNYTDAQDEVNKADYTLSGTLAVNGSSVKVVYDGVEKPITNINVTKATYNMTAANAAASVAQEQVYNQSAQAFAFDDSKLPGGVTVDTITYTNTADNTSSTTAPTNVGVYTVTISFNQANINDYNKVADITSQLTIKQAKVTGISFEPAVKPEITGETYTLVATGVPEWVTVTYSVTDEDNKPLEGTEFGAAGAYKFTATFTHDNPNYEQLKPMTATLTISDKPPVEGANDIVVEQTITATYTGSPVDYSAKNVPEGVGVSYEILKDGKPFEGTEIIEVGEYTITVKFDTGAANAPIADKPCVVTISQGTYDMDGVELTGDRTVIYDGDEHELTLSGTLPDGVVHSIKYYLNGEETTPKAVGTYDVVVSFTNPDPVNYKDIGNITATLTISDAVVTGISASVEDGARFDINNTLDDVKAKLTVTAVYDNGNTHAVTEFTLTCEGGLLEVGKQTVTVTYNDGMQDFTTTVEIEVSKAKVALPVYKNTLSYTGGEIKPTAADFDGFNSALMAFVESKTVAGLNAGAYKAVFALKDADRYEWATVMTLKKTVFAAVVYDEIVLEDYETAVEWNLAKAKITATKADGKLPVFASESFTGSLADIVGLKYYTDEACTEEVAADKLGYSTKYYVKAELLNNENFELDESAMALSRTAFEYTTPEKQLTIWEKIIKFVTVNWLWIAIAAAALLLLIIIIACAARASKKKREREEQRRLEEKEERMREKEEREERRREEREERMARMSQQQMMMPQMMPQGMSQSGGHMQAGGSVGGGSISEAQILQMQAELAELKAEKVAKEAAQQQIAQAKTDMQFAGFMAQLMGGGSLDKLTEIIRTEVRNALADEKAALATAEHKAEEAKEAAPVCPPDAVMTTVTTTKIDTTKKPQTAERAATPAPAGRTVVRNVVAPMPVDDGRVFDVGGFYTPADPVADEGSGEEDKD